MRSPSTRNHAGRGTAGAVVLTHFSMRNVSGPCKLGSSTARRNDGEAQPQPAPVLKDKQTGHCDGEGACPTRQDLAPNRKADEPDQAGQAVVESRWGWELERGARTRFPGAGTCGREKRTCPTSIN